MRNANTHVYLPVWGIVLVAIVSCEPAPAPGIPASAAEPRREGAEVSARPYATELERISVRYGIELHVAAEPGQVWGNGEFITWASADESDMRSYASIFSNEFVVYPVEFVAQVKLRRVVFCGSLAFGRQARSAIPDFSTHTLYLDASAGNYDSAYRRKVVHHELFHMIDYVDDGLLYIDAHWSALNPVGWQYGSGGRNARDRPDSSLLTDKFPGFVSYYSTTGVEEDKAEIFANLIVDPTSVRHLERGDSVLAAKINRLGVMLRAFSPDAGNELWDRISAPSSQRR